MIDPKFNSLPVDAEGDFEESAAAPLSGRQHEGPTKPREGLSINETVAAAPNLSVGSRGVDTSGASVGSGAGAGMTFVTPEDDGSPAPNIVPGSRGSGTTVRGDFASSQMPTTRLEAGTESAGVSSFATEGFTAEEVSARAHQCWRERGCPTGSPEVDWARAVQQLREEKELRSSASA